MKTVNPHIDLTTDSENIRLMDINGDGLPDMVQVRTFEVDVWLSRITSFTDRTIIAAPYGMTLMKTDRSSSRDQNLYFYAGFSMLGAVVADEGFLWNDLRGHCTKSAFFCR